MLHFLALSRIRTSRSKIFKFKSVVAMLPMYGVLKPFSVTCHGHGNIALTVEGCLDLGAQVGSKVSVFKKYLEKNY